VKREIKSEIVTVRLTPTERARLDELGGPAEVLRRALQPPPMQVVPITTTPTRFVVDAAQFTVSAPSCVHWQDGTVGPTWPALATA
jgi:hypothetical protein